MESLDQSKVKRTGSYRLTAGDTLKNLLEIYAGGFAPGADNERIIIQRRTVAAGVASRA